MIGGGLLARSSQLAAAAWALAAALGFAPVPASAQDTPVPIDRGAEVAPSDDLVVYDEAFFREAKPATALDMIRRLPAFVLDKKAKSRGLGAARGNVLIDGLPFASKAETVDAALDRIPARDVVRIEVGRDGAFGDVSRDYTSVANVVLVSGRRTRQFVILDGNLQQGGGGGEARFEALTAQGGFTGEAAASVYSNTSRFEGGRYVRTTPDGGGIEGKLIENSSSSGLKLRGGVKWDAIGARTSLDLTLNDDRGVYGSSVQTTSQGTLEALRSKYDRRAVEVVGRATRTVTPRLRLDASVLQSVSQTRSKDQYGYSAPAFTYRNDYRGAAGETVVRVVASTDMRHANLEAGAEGAYNWLDARSTYVENGAVVALPAQRSKIHEERGELFLRARAHLGSRINLDGGVALEASRIAQSTTPKMSSEFSLLKPELAVTYSPRAGAKIHLSATRTASQLNFGDFVTSVSAQRQQVIVGNPRLQPPREWKVELGFDQAMGRGAISVAAGRTELEKTLDYVAIGAFDAPGNIGRGDRRYLTGAVTIPISVRWLRGASLNASGSAFDSRVTDPVTGQSRRLSNEAALVGSLTLRQDLTRWPVSWSLDAQANSRTRSYRLAEVREYRVRPTFGVQIEYRPSRTLNLTLRLQSSARATTRRIIYEGSRASGAVLSVEDRLSRPGSSLYLHLRRRL